MITDTIVALSTPPGRSAIAIVRLSGPESHAILSRCFAHTGALTPRTMHYGRLSDIDDCMAALFTAPASYTGEDMAEVYLHGGLMPQAQAIDLFVAEGARIALPGEFSRRAYMNGKLSMTAAESVIELIDAKTKAQAKNALRGVRGRLGSELCKMIDELTDMLAYIEAVIEYPEEDFDDGNLVDRINSVANTTKRLRDSYAQGRLLSAGYRVAIAGRPNVGKSSLLNQLIGAERSIVTDVAGTTRDVVDAAVDVDGLTVRFFDTAGIRETADAVEHIGVERSKTAIDDADLTILTIDVSEGLTPQDEAVLEYLSGRDFIVALNKTDLDSREREMALGNAETVRTCAATGEGVKGLKRRIRAHAGLADTDEYIVTSARHADALSRACASLAAAAEAAQSELPADMIGIDLRDARTALGEITGTAIDEHIVDRIFENFCLGK